MEIRKKIGLGLAFVLFLGASYALCGYLFLLFQGFSPSDALVGWTPSMAWDAFINEWPHRYESLGASVGSLLGMCVLVYLAALVKSGPKLHGDARFATAGSIAQAGLFAKEASQSGNGIIVGKFNNRLLTFGGSQFVSLGAPTRSGKGVGIVIPNLLNWAQSAVVLDIKQECFDITSKYRSSVLKQEVFLFNPFSYRTHRYNPLGPEYLEMSQESADGNLSDIARILYPATGKDDFWPLNAQSLFVGLCFLAYELEIPLTLSGIYKLAQGDQGEPLEAVIEKRGKHRLSERCMNRLAPYLGMPEQTQGSVRSTFETPLSMFLSDEVASATSCNDFDFNNLRRKPTTIYIGITPDKLNSAGILINLFLSQCISQNIRELPQSNAALKYKCLLLMDEFTSIGTMEVVRKSCSFIAGYGLRLLTIYQSKSQLQDEPPKGYGREGALTLLTNHALQIYYAPREQEDAEGLSKSLGNKTVKVTSRSYSKEGSRSVSEQQRALMLPQEVKEIGMWKSIILLENCAPILCEKIKYFADPMFIERLKAVSPSLRRVKGIPSQGELEGAFQNRETGIEVAAVESVGAIAKEGKERETIRQQAREDSLLEQLMRENNITMN